MTNYAGDFDMIKSVIAKIKKKYEEATNWKTKNVLEFKRDKKIDGTITFKDLKVDVVGKTINDLFKKFKKIYDDAEKNKMKEKDLKKTPFKNLYSNISKYGGIEKNKEVINKLLSKFKKIGVENIMIEKSISQNNSIKDDLELFINVSPNDSAKPLETGYAGRLRTFLFDEKFTDQKEKTNIRVPVTHRFLDLPNEKVIDMKVKNMLIGHYYPERNVVSLYFNPFEEIKCSVFDTEIPNVWNIILKLFEVVKVRKHNTDEVQEKIFIGEFLKHSRDKLQQIDRDKKSVKKSIGDYERNVRDYIRRYTEMLNDEEFIKTTLDNNGKGLFAEVKKLNKLPFVDKVSIKNGMIDILYKPTFIPIPKMIRSDSGKNYGKRYAWIGAIGFKISGNSFNLYGNVNINGNCHPHGSHYPEGQPCFGYGEGSEKIHSLLAQNRFYDLAKMLWFWIKTYKNNGAYVKVWKAYDSILKQGYPILDEKGKRIEINDPERIKSGEQRQLSKESNYETNFKKFGSTKLE